MNYNPSTKSEFLKYHIAVKNHHELVENPVLRRHIEFALSEMQRRAAQGTPPGEFNACAAAHLRMLGAQDFLDIFLNLAEASTPTTKTDTSNLPGNVSTMPTRKN